MAKVLETSLGKIPVIAVNGVKRYNEIPKEPITLKKYKPMLDYRTLGDIAKSKSQRKIRAELEKWDIDYDGEVTAKSLAAHTGMGKKTVLNHWNYFEKTITEINSGERKRKQDEERRITRAIAENKRREKQREKESFKKRVEEDIRKKAETEKKRDDGWGF